MARQFDRAAEDLGNIVALEHVNVQVEDQRPATLYYISALGLTVILSAFVVATGATLALDETEGLSPGQADEIGRVRAARNRLG